jgi:sec-independent protein translocase protein TatB
MADSLILMVIALVVFGPRRLPQIGKQIGKLMFEFRKASNDFKFQMEEELRLSEDADRRKKEEEKRKQLAQESVSATPDVVKTLESPSSESPYSEGMYPPVSEVKTDFEIKNGETAGAEDAAPRILPPSTGETVAATKVAVDAELTEPAADKSSKDVLDPMGQVEQAAPGGEDKSPSGNENAPATETVNHNG